MKFLAITLIVHAPDPFKVHRYHDQFGHSVMHLHADASGLTDAQHRESLELFQSDIAPVLRRDIPEPPWPADVPAEPARLEPARPEPARPERGPYEQAPYEPAQ
jgi:hypothetical protein